MDPESTWRVDVRVVSGIGGISGTRGTKHQGNLSSEDGRRQYAESNDYNSRSYDMTGPPSPSVRRNPAAS